MRKMIALLLASSAIASPALASEHVGALTTLTLQSGYTLSGGNIVASGVYATRALKNDSGIIQGHHYNYSITISGYSGTGQLRVAVGAPKMTVTGVSEPVTCGLQGLCPIADNFDTNLGLVAAPSEPESTEAVGAFRFAGCKVAKYANDDSVVLRGQAGSSHGHRFIGNTGSNANSTYASLRRSGGTSCGNSRYSIMRASYWEPFFVDGTGAMLVSSWENFYYKRLPASSPGCGFPDATHVGICTNLPHGLAYVAGYNMATMSGGSSATGTIEGSSFSYECRQKEDFGTRYPGVTGSYPTIKAVVDAGCPANAVLYVASEGPTCWNGTEVDSADHRSHMKYATGPTVSVAWTLGGVAQTPSSMASCPSTHPYVLATFAWAKYFLTDADFVAGRWHLSSDEQMPMAVDAGTTLHLDYRNAWSPAFLQSFHDHCLDGHLTCSGGNDGNLKTFETRGSSTPSLAKHPSIPISRTGLSAPIKGNGTFTGQLTAISSGQLYTLGYGFSGTITAFSITDAP